MQTIVAVKDRLGVAPACAAMGLALSSYYRQMHPRPARTTRRIQARALSPLEREGALAMLHEPRFADLACGQIYTRLLDEGRYLCSERTLYRILEENKEVRERRDQLRHPAYQKPELLATAPNQVWSWDITKLRTQCLTSNESKRRASSIPSNPEGATVRRGQIEGGSSSGSSVIWTLIWRFSVRRNCIMRPLPSGSGGALALIERSTSAMIRRILGEQCMCATRCTSMPFAPSRRAPSQRVSSRNSAWSSRLLS